MKNLLIFASGVVIGAVGAIIWLRKDIKKQISELESSKNGQISEELPFEMSENEAEAHENADKVTINEPVTAENHSKIEYNKISSEAKMDENRPFDVQNERKVPVPVMPRDENKTNFDDFEAPEEEESVVPRAEIFFEIDQDDFEHDDEYDPKRLVYFNGDKIMCTESGTVIENPYLFVGNQWEQFVGHYAEHTAFIRNTRLKEDYEIYVEPGAYVDEYGYDSL